MKIQPRHLRAARKIIIPGLLLVAFSLRAEGQNWTQYDRGTPPQHATGVSPLGSYISTEIGTVNLSNGALNIHLPMATVGGRGFDIPIALNYSSKVWSVGKDSTPNLFYSGDVLAAYANYGENQPFLGIYNGLGPVGWSTGGVPLMKSQFVGIGHCDSGGYEYGLTKLTAVMPDGGEIELRDDAYDGAARVVNCTLYNDVPRGNRWHATDGSGTIFIYDNFPNPAGTLTTGDGTRYRFDSVFAPAVRITDRNGNQISINHSVDSNNPAHVTVEYIDQLGRSTKAEQNAPDPANPSVTLALLVTIKGYQPAERYYKVKTDLMGNLIRSDLNYNHLPIVTGNTDTFGHCYQGGQPPAANYMFPDSYCRLQQRLDDQGQVSEVVLPDSRSLHFKYNLYGEVAEVQLPTGARLQYDYATAMSGLPSGNTLSIEYNAQINGVFGTDRAVVERRTYPDGTTLEGTWTYGFGTGCGAEVRTYAGTSSTGTLLLYQCHYFLPAGRYLYQDDYSVTGDGYSLWSTGLERRSETRDSAGNVISAIEKDWAQRTPVQFLPGASYGEQPANDNRVSETRRYLETGSFAKTDILYDNLNYPRANNVSEVKEYDFDQSLKRRTTNAYVTGNYQTDDTIHLLSLPQQQSVYAANGTTEMARTVNEYDVYVRDGNNDYLTDYGAVIGHDSSYGAGKTARGNLTAVGHWLNTNNTIPYSYLRYDTLGNPVGNKDANGNLTTLSYTDDFGNGSNPGGGASGTYGATYALPTLITSPPPQPNQAPHTARSQYDFSTGLLTGSKDRNGIVTQSIYDDPFSRPTLIKSALNITGTEAHTAIYYAQSTPITVYGVTLTNNDVLTAKDQTNLDDAALRSWTHTDGFGRTVEAWSRDPIADDKVSTVYDALGRVKQVSNPFRLGETPIYTTTGYDLAGRVTSVTTSDNAVIGTAYSENRVLVTDQAWRQRISKTNALGQLTDVWETTPNDPAHYPGIELVSFPYHAEVTAGYHTSYTYDSLDNLLTSTQGPQPPRNFVYNSLKQLISATNPESGTTCYGTVSSGQCQANGYDANGNLIYKTDARGVLTSFAPYDALNRPTSKSYSDGTPPDYLDRTPTVAYTYDSPSVSNAKGRLTSVSSSVSTYSYTGYDALGRVSAATQTLGSQNYSLSYGYDRADHVKSMTYPSGNVVNYAYDLAGRLADYNGQFAFSGYLGDGALRTYASISGSYAYDAASRMQEEKFGTAMALYHKQHYNIRGQLYDVRLSSQLLPSWDWDRGAVVSYYSTNNIWGGSGTDNNGDVITSETYIPGSDWFQDRYAYDPLNRLISINEFKNGSSQTISQYNYYDQWGNRTINTAASFGYPATPTSVDTNTNRMYAQGDPSHTLIDYDAAGNQSKDYLTWNGTRTYDAENKMIKATNGTTATYSYDGDGRRVKRKIGTLETWQVYGAGGELVAEYAPNAPPATPDKEYGYRNGQLLVTAAKVDLALGKTPTQSSTFTNAGVTFTASLAIDGNTDGTFWDVSSATTNYGYQNWWQVDLGSSQSIGSIQVWPRTDCCPEHTANFYVLVSDNPFTSTDLNTTLNQWGVANYWVTGNNATPATVSVNRTGRYVRVQRNDSQYLVLAEVKVWQSAADLEWLVTDQLGTPRMIADETGSLAGIKRHDYLPFGEELFGGPANQPGSGGRLITQGYSSADGLRQKFTVKERDIETRLDWFDSRYYASLQGRFTSPDHFEGNPVHLYADYERSPALPYSSLLNPQTLNAYAYVYNDPLSNVDPDGHQGGRKIPLPGNRRYQIRADIRNPNDAPNIHVFDKGGRREIGRVSIKPGGNEWSGKVPQSVKTDVEAFVRDKGIQPRLPSMQPRPRAAGAEAEAGGAGEVGGTSALRGTSNAISILAFITGIIDEVFDQRQAERNGYYLNYQGQMVITNLSRAAENFPAHSYLDFGGHFWVPKGNTFVPLDHCDCTLEQDKDGSLHVVYRAD